MSLASCCCWWLTQSACWARIQLAKRASASPSDAATRDPKRVIHKIAHGPSLWCLVEYAAESDVGDDDSAPELAWLRFASAEELQAYAARATGEPIVVPERSLTPYESERAVRVWFQSDGHLYGKVLFSLTLCMMERSGET